MNMPVSAFISRVRGPSTARRHPTSRSIAATKSFGQGDSEGESVRSPLYRYCIALASSNAPKWESKSSSVVILPSSPMPSSMSRASFNTLPASSTTDPTALWSPVTPPEPFPDPKRRFFMRNALPGFSVITTCGVHTIELFLGVAVMDSRILFIGGFSALTRISARVPSPPPYTARMGSLNTSIFVTGLKRTNKSTCACGGIEKQRGITLILFDARLCLTVTIS